MAIQTQCPHCEKMFSLKAATALGKKCKCPKCEEVFVVKKYRAPEPELEDSNYDFSDDDYEDYSEPDEQAEDYEEAPRRKSSASSSSRKGRSSKKSKNGGGAKWLKPVLIGLVALCGVGLVGWLGYFAISQLGGRNIVNLQYFPEETEMIFHTRVGKMWDAPLLSELKNNPQLQKQIADAQQGLNIAPGEIESLTVGVTNLSQRRSVNRFSGAFGPIMASGPQQAFGVMRTTRDINASELPKAAETAPETHAGQTLHAVNQNGRSMTVWLASPRTFVFGDAAAVKQAIDRGPKEFRFKHFDFGSSMHQFFLIAGTRGEVLPNGTGTPATLDAAMNQYSKGMYLGVSLNSEVVLESKIACLDSTGATAVKGHVDKGLADAKQQLASLNPLIAGQIQPLVDLGKETLDSIQINASGSTVQIDGRISNKVVDALKQLANNPMFSGALGGSNPTMPQTNQPLPISPGGP